MDVISLNVFQKTIENIVAQGYSVIQIFPLVYGEQSSAAYYFLVHKFIAAQRTPTDDIQYNQLIGINITDLVNSTSALNKDVFIHKLNEYISQADVVRLEFPNNVRWLKFGNA